MKSLEGRLPHPISMRLQQALAHDTIFVSCRKGEFEEFSRADW